MFIIMLHVHQEEPGSYNEWGSTRDHCRVTQWIAKPTENIKQTQCTQQTILILYHLFEIAPDWYTP